MQDTDNKDAGPSSYYDERMIAEGVARGGHRDMVGGLWEELGGLQFELLRNRGLRPEHRLLDIGCGCLRGGVRFAAYLDPGNYFGLDVNQSLLDAGRTELVAAGLSERVPEGNLRRGGDFHLAGFGQTFDMAVAVSLFTHLPAPHLRICLERLTPVLKPGGSFCASFFLLPEGQPFAEPFDQTPEITSHPERDPYHYRMEDIRAACLGLPWTARLVGDWKHPRNQRLVVFERSPEGLRPGDADYRAYVGPPERYDLMGASQFALLFHLGLREQHRVLDFGCGSLRLGRLLIPWLAPGRYYGIEPNAWLIEEGFARELGQEVRELKQPSFDHNADFDCAAFGTSFDFVMAQSILTHCGPELCRRFFAQMAKVLEPDGLALVSYSRANSTPLPAEGWHYPQCVSYSESVMLDMARAAELYGSELAWSHPGATWFAVARRPELLERAAAAVSLAARAPERPAEICARLASFEAWCDFLKTNPYVHDRAYIDSLAGCIAAEGFHCPYYGKRIAPAEIVVGAPNYREGLTHGGLNSRLRAVWLELLRFQGQAPAERLRLYAPEAVTHFAELLRARFPDFTGSEFYPCEAERRKHPGVRHEDLLGLSFPDASFDVVLVNDVFEHVPDIDRCLGQLARVVRRGGRLITTFPFNIGARSSVVKARLTPGGIEHLAEPEYHGNPVDRRGSLVFEIPGWDILDRALAAGWVKAEIVYETSAEHGVLGGGFSGIFTMVAER